MNTAPSLDGFCCRYGSPHGAWNCLVPACPQPAMREAEKSRVQPVAVERITANPGGWCNAHRQWPDSEWRCAVPTCPGRDPARNYDGATE